MCPVAEKLNEVYGLYSPCPNNEHVQCFFKETCDRCGWNPEVSLERLKRMYPEYLSAILGQD